jgi:hypothetical protein
MTTTSAVPTQGTEKAQYVLGLLTSAGLRSPWGIDIGDAEVLWATQLDGFGIDVLERTAKDWISADTHDFPALGEFTSMADVIQRQLNRDRAIKAGMEHRQPNQVCPECDENEGWVDLSEEPVGIATVRPCSICRPEQHAIWNGGCFEPKHLPCERCRGKGQR